MVFGSCPDCGRKLAVGLEPLVGQQISCLECGALLQVSTTDPVTLDWSDDDFIDYDIDDDDLYEDEDDDLEEDWRRTRHQKARDDW